MSKFHAQPPTLIALRHDDYHATGMGRIKNSVQVLVLEDYLRMSDLITFRRKSLHNPFGISRPQKRTFIPMGRPQAHRNSKSQAAPSMSLIEMFRQGARWKVVRRRR